ncbi:aminoglycoside phosphotransferase family protein [Lentilitoribacter sp. EG35]|uniref:aminoglycoside phosphotransferase family protein n=1 Tax=Lentilitoribacter sp. EG35 TaxID=3234192 RepID=UPI00345F9FE4
MIGDGNEIPLSGGNVNSSVVRVGDTVRRKTSWHSPIVHRFLKHLEVQGFEYSPRFLGIDEKKREILSFMPGSSEFPKDMWKNDKILIASAKMLRKFHDASESFGELESADWAFTPQGDTPNEVICHNDFAPYNLIFDGNGTPTAIIDFDLSGPAPRLRDLAYLTYWMVPLSFQSNDMGSLSTSDLAMGSQRLKIICAAYGTDDYLGLLDMLANVLIHMGDYKATVKILGEKAANNLKNGGHMVHWQKEAEAFKQMLPKLRANF